MDLVVIVVFWITDIRKTYKILFKSFRQKTVDFLTLSVERRLIKVLVWTLWKIPSFHDLSDEYCRGPSSLIIDNQYHAVEYLSGRRLTRYVVAGHVDECDVGSKLKHAVVHGSSVGIFSLPISFLLNQPAVRPCRTSRLYQKLVGRCCRIRGVSWRSCRRRVQLTLTFCHRMIMNPNQNNLYVCNRCHSRLNL